MPRSLPFYFSAAKGAFSTHCNKINAAIGRAQTPFLVVVAESLKVSPRVRFMTFDALRILKQGRRLLSKLLTIYIWLFLHA